MMRIKLPENGLAHRFLVRWCMFPKQPYRRHGQWLFIPDWWHIANNKTWPLSRLDKLLLWILALNWLVFLFLVAVAEAWWFYVPLALLGEYIMISLLISVRNNEISDKHYAVRDFLSTWNDGSIFGRRYYFSFGNGRKEVFPYLLKYAVRRIVVDGCSPQNEVDSRNVFWEVSQTEFTELADLIAETTASQQTKDTA